MNAKPNFSKAWAELPLALSVVIVVALGIFSLIQTLSHEVLPREAQAIALSGKGSIQSIDSEASHSESNRDFWRPENQILPIDQQAQVKDDRSEGPWAFRPLRLGLRPVKVEQLIDA